MQIITSFKIFEARVSSSVKKTHEPIDVTSVKDFIKEVGKFDKNLLNAGWTYDEFSSKQADSKYPSCWCNCIYFASRYALVIMHDDYDNTEWGVSLIDTHGDSGDEVIVEIHNLEEGKAWSLFQKIAGKKNTIYRNDKGENITWDAWDALSKIRLSKKLSKTLDIGVFDKNEALDINDPIVMAMRATTDREKAGGAAWTIKKKILTSEQLFKLKEEEKAERKRVREEYRRDYKISLIDAKIADLERDYRWIMKDMESDPTVEAEGGAVADHYGEQLNKLDKEINKLRNKRNLLENPIEASKILKNAKKIGVFEKD